MCVCVCVCVCVHVHASPITCTTFIALLVLTGRVAGDGGDSDREGSITPTNETPPSEELLEESTTPKDKVAQESLIL